MTPHALRIRTGIEGERNRESGAMRFRAFVVTSLGGEDKTFTDREWRETEADALKRAGELAAEIRGFMKGRGFV